MAVQRAVLNNTEVLLFTGTKKEMKNSCGHWVKKVDNIPGLGKYNRAIVEMRDEVLRELSGGFFAHNLHVINDSVCHIEKQEDIFKLVDGCGRTYYARYVVLATGMMQEQPLIQGSIKPILSYANGQRIGYCCLCDGHRSYGKKTVVIGHTASALYTAELLAERYELKEIAILTNGITPEFISEEIPVFQSPIAQICGNEHIHELEVFKLESGEVIDADICFVSLGIRPNNRLALQLNALLSDAGLVITDEVGETSVPNLFVIGDLRAGTLKQIYTAWQHAVDVILEIDNRFIKE